LSISQKVQAVEEAFLLLHQEMSDFQGWSGITCKTGCGKCCTKPDIEATVLEFLPFAHHVYLQNQWEEWLIKLKEHADSICVFFSATQVGSGLCTQYAHRGLICRLFGFSARTNKYAKREFVTCQTIKSEQSEKYNAVVEKIGSGSLVPVMNNHYMRLHAIDPNLGLDFYPINEAIKRAIETVLHYYAYRN
jgi:Fe-S-cluster containining protein